MYGLKYYKGCYILVKNKEIIYAEKLNLSRYFSARYMIFTEKEIIFQ